jgi:hypothetical protein
MGATQHLSVGQRQMYRLGKAFGRYVGKLIGGLLKGGVGHAIAGQMLPVFDPNPAESALAIED